MEKRKMKGTLKKECCYCGLKITPTQFRKGEAHFQYSYWSHLKCEPITRVEKPADSEFEEAYGG